MIREWKFFSSSAPVNIQYCGRAESGGGIAKNSITDCHLLSINWQQSDIAFQLEWGESTKL